MSPFLSPWYLPLSSPFEIVGEVWNKEVDSLPSHTTLLQYTVHGRDHGQYTVTGRLRVRRREKNEESKVGS